MCGIFGCVRDVNAAQTSLDGLARLEYRGYDSAGLVGEGEGKLTSIRRVGKVSALKEAVQRAGLEQMGGAVLTHTRWATHGAIAEGNAHPILSPSGRFACVHNGIIENYFDLKKSLVNMGVEFASETDTEVIVQLAEQMKELPLRQIVFEIAAKLKGRSSFALVDKERPGVIVAAALGSSLIVGIGSHLVALASDVHAFDAAIQRTFVVPMGHVVELKASGAYLFNSLQKEVAIRTEPFEAESLQASRGEHAHFMYKEILEQPQILAHLLKTAGQLPRSPKHVLLLGCGTSWHAGGLAACWIEKELGISAEVKVASEFRYSPALIPPDTLVIAISQSGETADTLAAVELAKAKGAFILAICNTTSSALGRLADKSIPLQAGPEIGVASTKTYSATLAIVWRMIGGALPHVAGQMQETLELAPAVEALAKEWSHYSQMLMIGRGVMLWTAREAALKIKELAYVHASAYAAGELKHGPIALIDETCPTILFCSEEHLAPKIFSSLMEIQARSGRALLIAPKRLAHCFEGASVEALLYPSSCEAHDPFLATGLLQLFAYYVAQHRGCAIDQPRNLAKSVTVE